MAPADFDIIPSEYSSQQSNYTERFTFDILPRITIWNMTISYEVIDEKQQVRNAGTQIIGILQPNETINDLIMDIPLGENNSDRPRNLYFTFLIDWNNENVEWDFSYILQQFYKIGRYRLHD